MAQVQLFRSASDFDTIMYLAISSPSGVSHIVANFEMTGISSVFAAIDGVSQDDVEDLLAEAAKAAATVLEKRITLVQRLREAKRQRNTTN